MSFIEIKNPAERERIVKDYVNTLREIRDKDENERAVGMQRKIELERKFNPIVQATKESTSQITEEIRKNRAVHEKQKGYWDKSFAEPAIKYYLGLKNNIDQYYGIQKKGDEYVMGDKKVEMDKESNIIINGDSFPGTPGLWNLIMLADPADFTKDDFTNYEEIVDRTQVIFNPLKKKASDKPKSTAKYRKILKKLEEQYEEEESAETSAGEGISFLPGNISGLLNRLELLAAEHRSGNTVSTRNEIVAILDELLRQKYFTQRQYNTMCRSLSC